MTLNTSSIRDDVLSPGMLTGGNPPRVALPGLTPRLQGLATGAAGMGDKDHVFPVGSFYATPPGMVHHFVADEDTMVQVNSTGPWASTTWTRQKSQ